MGTKPIDGPLKRQANIYGSWSRRQRQGAKVVDSIALGVFETALSMTPLAALTIPARWARLVSRQNGNTRPIKQGKDQTIRPKKEIMGTSEFEAAFNNLGKGKANSKLTLP